jgi:hypothetical protein
LEGRRWRFRGDTRHSGEVENFFICHPELLGELMDTDLLRRHVSIQPFPVVIPSPLTGSVGALFVMSKHSTDGFDVVVIETDLPRSSKLLANNGCFKTLRLDHRLAVVCSTEPRSPPVTRTIGREYRAWGR